MVVRLENLGKEMVEKAYRHGMHEYEANTNNLDAGYAYVVYLRGHIAYNTDREQAIGFSQGHNEDLGWHHGWPKRGIPDGTAVEWFERWLKSYKPKTMGFELVVLNATYYARILEEGAQIGYKGIGVFNPSNDNKKHTGSQKKYKIVTYLIDDLYQRGQSFGKNVSVSVL
jgi:hypothetical protein